MTVPDGLAALNATQRKIHAARRAFRLNLTRPHTYGAGAVLGLPSQCACLRAVPQHLRAHNVLAGDTAECPGESARRKSRRTSFAAGPRPRRCRRRGVGFLRSGQHPDPAVDYLVTEVS